MEHAVNKVLKKTNLYDSVAVMKAIVTEIDTSRPPKLNTSNGYDPEPSALSFHPHVFSHCAHPKIISI